jgi:hypothetical protein
MFFSIGGFVTVTFTHDMGPFWQHFSALSGHFDYVTLLGLFVYVFWYK